VTRRGHKDKTPQARPDKPAVRAAAGGVSSTLMGIAGQTKIVAPDFDKLSAEVRHDESEQHARQAFGWARQREEIDRIIADCRAKLMIRPNEVGVLFNLGEALRQIDDHDGAIDAFRRAHAINPKLGSDFYLAALGVGEPPDRMSPKLVTALFDSYAGAFDNHLTRTLKYHGPTKIAGILREVLGPDHRPLDVMDAGCGTGLVGVELRALARRLDGVDLSSKMIEKAREKAIYDRLIVDELCNSLRDNPRRYDLVVAADVLNYFGELGEPFAAAHAALRNDGHFAVSLERGEGGRPSLGSITRFRHPAPYVERIAAEVGFAVVRRDEFAMRFEKGKPVESWVYVFKIG